MKKQTVAKDKLFCNIAITQNLPLDEVTQRGCFCIPIINIFDLFGFNFPFHILYINGLIIFNLKLSLRKVIMFSCT